ncbi:MAG TPA: acyl-CoA dehydrogenase family protein [Tepidisphaeraceae bacterium]|jgi:alkylation response protein AidB-like acyl-CoA dehydrogenase
MDLDGPNWFRPTLDRIEHRAPAADLAGEWPQDDLDDLVKINAMKWCIPSAYGGEHLDAMELNDRYELLASASLSAALLLSQRDSAVGLIEVSSNESLRRELLPRLASNADWTTIGISHLTTSSRGSALSARRDGSGYRLDGDIPWASGATRASYIVAAAKLEEGRQLLFKLPTDAPGVCVQPPMRLATLSAAPTSAITCENVHLPLDLVLKGPAENVLSGRSKAVRISQAFAAFGLTRAALRLIARLQNEAAATTLDILSRQFSDLRQTVADANRDSDSHDLQFVPLLRSECNSLAMRATHAAVTLYKGGALDVMHPAQRLAREALFLLVWSSPTSVMDRNLEVMLEAR